MKTRPTNPHPQRTARRRSDKPLILGLLAAFALLFLTLLFIGSSGSKTDPLISKTVTSAASAAGTSTQAHNVVSTIPTATGENLSRPATESALTLKPLPATNGLTVASLPPVGPFHSNTATRSEAARHDLFDPLRRANTGVPRSEPNWHALADGLKYLSSLQGASVDRDTGQLILYGTRSATPGPFQLEDLVVALRAPFFQSHAIGMTIDPDEQDKHAPNMHVRYFGGSSNTHLGNVMFEVDRLMKCFSQGQDNLSTNALRPNLTNFYTHTEIKLGMNEAFNPNLWDRFWANIRTDRFPTNDSRGKSLLGLSQEHASAWLVQHRIWIDTKPMSDPGVGKALQSVEGRTSPSAQEFANLLTALYEQIELEFPVFGHLRELSKLVVFAGWLHDSSSPFDRELLHVRCPSQTQTAVSTPSLSTTNRWKEGNAIHEVRSLGGVSLQTVPLYVKSPPSQSEWLANNVERNRRKLRNGETVHLKDEKGGDAALIPVGPPERGPPVAVTAGGNGAVPITRVVEVRGRTHVASREPNDLLGNNFEMHVWKNPPTGEKLLNRPVLRTGFSVRHGRTVTFNGTVNVNVPDYIYITSPRRDIHIEFSTEPKFEPILREPYFPSSKADYYPNRKMVRLKDGTEYRFDDAGLWTEASMPGDVSVKCENIRFEDGSLRAAGAFDTRARAPPVRVVETVVRSHMSSREPELPGPNAQTIARITNLKTAQAADVVKENGEIYLKLKN